MLLNGMISTEMNFHAILSNKFTFLKYKPHNANAETPGFTPNSINYDINYKHGTCYQIKYIISDLVSIMEMHVRPECNYTVTLVPLTHP